MIKKTRRKPKGQKDISEKITDRIDKSIENRQGRSGPIQTTKEAYREGHSAVFGDEKYDPKKRARKIINQYIDIDIGSSDWELQMVAMDFILNYYKNLRINLQNHNLWKITVYNRETEQTVEIEEYAIEDGLSKIICDLENKKHEYSEEEYKKASAESSVLTLPPKKKIII